MIVHRIYTEVLEDNPGRAYWNCNCGVGGSAPIHNVDIASDRHIEEGDQRVDVSKPDEGR